MERWNLDPVLIAALVCLASLHAFALKHPGGCGRTGDPSGNKIRLAGAWLLLAVIFVSPLCALTSALFSARVAHHVILVAVVAPLLVTGLPTPVRSLRMPVAIIGSLALVHAVVLWFWHAPVPYAAALASHGIFWLMELSLLGSAVALWMAVLSPHAPLGPVMAALLGTIMQTGLLGAVITFARAPLYAPHFATTEPWGLTALADQQLAGLIMWVPAAVPYLVAALAITGARLARIEGTDGRVR